ncbi:MAG: hypothetical protein ACLP50_29480, partial [Solirubrobacteraceae bacterium]
MPGSTSRSAGSEQAGNSGDIVGAAWVGRDAKDYSIRFVADVPGDDRAAQPFSGSKRFKLLADARLGSVGNYQLMT